MALYELTKTAITALEQTTFSSHNILERTDLQRLLKQHMEVIAPDTLVIEEEFCQWDESKRRIDLLAVDREANLVVVELKRSEDGGHMELQAIRYAAMVSAMSFSKAVEVYESYLKRSGSEGGAEGKLLRFFDWESANEQAFGQRVRILLVSSEFSKEITTCVLWLNEQGLDVRCVRLRPYKLDARVVLDVQQVIPLPEARQYTEQLKKKAEENREASSAGSDLSKYNLFVDGKTHSQLTKRRLVLEVVKAGLDKGLAPEQIETIVKPRRWISVGGELSSEEFQLEAAKLRAKLGGAYNLNRFFCDDDQLFRIDGRTYALTNQWGIHGTEPVVKEIIAMLPPDSVSYVKADEPD